MSDVCAVRRKHGAKECKDIPFHRGRKTVHVCRCGTDEHGKDTTGKYKSAAFKRKQLLHMQGKGTTAAGEKPKGVCIKVLDKKYRFAKCPSRYTPGTKIRGGKQWKGTHR